jgi:hypothetical protein
MYIIKVRDHEIATTRATLPAHAYSLFVADCGKWKSCVVAYKSLDLALAFIEKQAQLPKRFDFARDYRVFKKDGRKLVLEYEYIEKGE